MRMCVLHVIESECVCTGCYFMAHVRVFLLVCYSLCADMCVLLAIDSECPYMCVLHVIHHELMRAIDRARGCVHPTCYSSHTLVFVHFSRTSSARVYSHLFFLLIGARFMSTIMAKLPRNQRASELTR